MMTTSHNSKKWIVNICAVALILAGIGVRMSGLGFISFDMKDWLLLWYDKIAADGFMSLREPFSNYTPPYLYLLTLVTTTASFLPKVAAIKLISIVFDLCNALMVYRILKVKYQQGSTALLGASGFLLLPTVFLNSAFWGQSDSIYTFFLLACLYYLMKDQPLPAILFLGISFAFKAQAVFLAPLLLLLTLRKRIPWFYFGIVPIVYVLLMIPAMLAGRPFMDLMTIYLDQADTYHGLSMHAPNLYVFVSNDFYDAALWAGPLITILVVCLWLWIYARKIKEFTPEIILVCALASVMIPPFFLPKMHDRYFYLADVLSFITVFYLPGLWYLALGCQIVSGMAYSIFLIPSAMPMKRSLADAILNWSAIVNTLVVSLVFWSQWKVIEDNTEKMEHG